MEWLINFPKFSQLVPPLGNPDPFSYCSVFISSNPCVHHASHSPVAGALFFQVAQNLPSQCSPTSPVLVKPLRLYMPPSLMNPNNSLLVTFSKPFALACRLRDTKSYLITTRCGAPPMCQNVPSPFSHWIHEIAW